MSCPAHHCCAAVQYTVDTERFPGFISAKTHTAAINTTHAPTPTRRQNPSAAGERDQARKRVMGEACTARVYRGGPGHADTPRIGGRRPARHASPVPVPTLGGRADAARGHPLTRVCCALLEVDSEEREVDVEEREVDIEERGVDVEEREVDSEERGVDSEEQKRDTEERGIDPFERRVDPRNRGGASASGALFGGPVLGSGHKPKTHVRGGRF
jgi:hypothetical protein